MKDDYKNTNKTGKKNPLQGYNVSKLANLRIIQKNLVYVIGLSSNLANKDVSIDIIRYYQNMNTLDNMEQ